MRKFRYDYNKFEVRIGVNAATDNLVTDINGRRNIAGKGINTAARIMSVAENNQIFVGSKVYDDLSAWKEYVDAFYHYRKRVKHDIYIDVYQLISEGYPGLNIKVDIPEPSPEQTSKGKLTELAAHYFVHAIKNRDLFLSHPDNYLSAEGKTLLWFLANESLTYSKATSAQKTYIDHHGRKFSSISERYDHYHKQDYDLISLASKIIDKEIKPFSHYFEDYDSFIFVTPVGVKKLIEEKKDVCIELGLDLNNLDME